MSQEGYTRSRFMVFFDPNLATRWRLTILVAALSFLFLGGPIWAQDSATVGVESWEIPTPAEAEAAIKAETHQRIAGPGYSDEERQGILERMEKLRILESLGCYPALDRPDDRICVLRSIGWQGEPFFSQPSMTRTEEGWQVLEETLKPACPSQAAAQAGLRDLLSDDSLRVLAVQDTDRFGLFDEEGADTPRLRCRYDVRHRGPERRVTLYARYVGGRYTFDEEPKLY